LAQVRLGMSILDESINDFQQLVVRIQEQEKFQFQTGLHKAIAWEVNIHTR
jgi:hypothetical protein